MPIRYAKQIGSRIATGMLLLTSALPVKAQDKIEAVKANVTSEIRDPKIIIPPIKNEPRWKFRKPLEDRSRRRFILLSVGVYAAAAMDMQESVSLMPRFHEDDPFTKPFARLPVPACYATGFAFSTGLNWLAWKLARSEKWHKVWWIPQVCSIAGNMAGYGYTKTHENRH
jgi:hypothetical protein